MQALGVKMHNVFQSLSGAATFSATHTHTHTHTHTRTGNKDPVLQEQDTVLTLNHRTEVWLGTEAAWKGWGKILFQSKLGVRNSRMGERQLPSEHFRIPHTSKTFKNCAELGVLRFSSAFKAIYSKVIKSKWNRCPHCTTSLHSYFF